MNEPSNTATGGQTRLAIVVGAAIVIGAVAVFAISSRSTTAHPTGGRPPIVAVGSPSPSVRPSPTATPVPSPTNTPAPSGPPTVKLENASNHRVVAQVIDQLGTVDSVVSGRPGDGMSVRWHDSIVENVDARTIRLTWVALPQDDQLGIGFAVVDGHEQITVVQAGPPRNSDALGEDRVVLVTFDHPVDADDLAVEILDRTID